MTNNQSQQEQIIHDLIKDGIFTKNHLVKLQREKCRKFGGAFFRNIDLLKTYHKLVKSKKAKGKSEIENLLTIKQIRSLSGIVVVSVLTKPYPCPGKCLYCPTQKNVPKSYLSNEPAVMRAIALNYDPYIQTKMRLKALEEEGHPTDKINIRIIGGTWSYYPKKYREWFIKRVFEACNQDNKLSLKHENIKSFKQYFERGMSPEIAKYSTISELGSQKWIANATERPTAASVECTPFGNERAKLLESSQHQNETAKHRIVEISIETRQDFIDENEIKHLRKLGVTKVELGVQSIYDDILKKNLRGHLVQETIRATKMLKDAGFKVSYQMMLNLYGANIKSDKKMFKELFRNSNFRPDHLKIYPLALVKESKLYDFYKKKKFSPYTKAQLIDALKYIKKQIPYYCRIERIIRDIPSESIVEGGTKFSNMRQILQKELIEEGTPCKCIRCREVRDNLETKKLRNRETKRQFLERRMLLNEVPVESVYRVCRVFSSEANRKLTNRMAREAENEAISERNNIYLFIQKYSASGGIEYFLSLENKDRTKLYSLLRLRIPSQILEHKKHFLSVLNGAAIIREIHTYGKQVEISRQDNIASQHKGLGKILIQEAENIVRKGGLKKIAVISGVGVRGYFRKLGYQLENDYMTKILD